MFITNDYSLVINVYSLFALLNNEDFKLPPNLAVLTSLARAQYGDTSYMYGISDPKQCKSF